MRRIYTLLLGIGSITVLTSCSSGRAMTTDTVVPLALLGGCLLTVLVLVLLIAVTRLQRKSAVLEQLGIVSWLAKIPVIGPYVGQAAALGSSIDRSKAAVDKTKRNVAKDRGQLADGEESAGVGDGVVIRPISAETTPMATGTTDMPTPLPVAQTENIRAVPLAAPLTWEQLDAASESDLMGRHFDRYQLHGRLGDSRFSSTFQAFDLKLRRPVFLKSIKLSLAARDIQRDQLLRHVRDAAGLNHPGIVEVYDYELRTDPNALFIVSEFVSGTPITLFCDHMRDQGQPVRPSQMLMLIAEAAEALDFAHKRGVLHGGIRPVHVMLQATDSVGQYTIFGDSSTQNARVRITDFGLDLLYGATALAPEEVRYYNAPEQFSGLAIDARTDVYSLGIVLYELITNQLPYAIDSEGDAATSHASAAVKPPSTIRPGLSQVVEAAMLKAIAKAPQDRFQSAAEFALVLHDLARTEAGSIDRTLESVALATGTQAAPYRVRITSVGEGPRTVPLEGKTMWLGAAADNDIVLPARGVGQRHARLEPGATGWRVIDLGTSTGSFIEGAPLLPDVAEEWRSGQILTVGPYSLRWLEGGEQVVVPVVVSAENEPTAVPTISATVLPAAAEVEPGDAADFQVTISNQTARVDHFSVTVQDIPETWVHRSASGIQLLPSAEGVVLISIVPPRDATVQAGVYPFQIRVTPMAIPELAVVISAEIRVSPFMQVAVDFHPESHRNKGTSQLALKNYGNREMTFVLSVRDDANALVVDELPPDVTLPSGTEAELPVHFSARKRPLMGAAQTHIFDMLVASARGDVTETRTGRLEITPYLPIWTMSVLLLLMAFLCIGGALGANYLLSERQQTTQDDALIADKLETNPIVAEATTPYPTSTPAAPQRCSSVLLADPEAQDGEYEIMLPNTDGQVVTIYCHDMASGMPREFVSLVNTGANSNFSSITGERGEIVVQFDKVRIELPTLRVDLSNRTFTVIEGALEDVEREIPPPDFATAVGCNDNPPIEIFGAANIDFNGSSFMIAPSVEWVLFGKDADGSAQVSEDRLSADMIAGGSCGWIWPAGDLLLEPNPIAQPASDSQ